MPRCCLRARYLRPLLSFPLIALVVALCSRSALAVSAKCPGGSPVGTFRIVVEPANAAPPLPLTVVNQIQAGARLRYEPVHLPEKLSKKGKVAVVLIAEKDDNSTDLRVLQPKPARAAQEWPVPVHASVVGLVFGEHGLDVKKVKSLVNDNPALVAQLTDYADRSSKVEALVQTLSNYEQSAPGSSNLQAMLHGFESQYGVSLPKLDTSAPADQQANTLLQALVPAFKSDDSDSKVSLAEHSTGLAASVASMFFGPQVGLAAGGAALLENLHTVVFPGTTFRPAFTQELHNENGLELCSGEQAAGNTRKNVAYLWLQRTPDAAAPHIRLTGNTHAALGWTSTITATTSSVAQLKLVSRVRDWRLVSSDGRAVPVDVRVTGNENEDTLSLDLRKIKLAPGQYQLSGKWDWTPVIANGTVDVRPLGDMSAAKLTDKSADSLITDSGDVTAEITGANFEFVKAVSIRSDDAPLSDASAVSFKVKPSSADPKDPELQATIDTSSLDAGAYLLRIQQVDGSSRDLPVTVHAPNPKLTGLPLRVNAGETQQTVVLRGRGLDRIERITSNDAEWKLSPAVENATERAVTVQLGPSVQRGETISANVFVTDLHTPLHMPAALRVLGPRPKILQVTKSLAGNSGIEIHDGEIPAGSPISFAIRVENVDSPPSVQLSCEEGRYAKQDLTLHAGEKNGATSFQSAGPGVLFLSVDGGAIGQPQCALQAKMLTSDGSSDPYTLGRIITVPHLEKFTLTDEKVGSSVYAGTLTGENLESIAKTGWSADAGNDVLGIATPVPGSPTQQTLKIAVPWPPPSPEAPLYIWLQGDTQGRLTTTKY